MKLYGIISPRTGWGPDLKSVWTEKDISIASNLEFVYGGILSTTTAEALKGKSIRIKYKNYGGTSAKEAPATELQNHANVAYYSPGLLAAAIDATSTTVQVYRAPHEPHLPQLPWDQKHPGGFKASTAAGNATTITANGTVTSYLTWLRIEGEYMKITKAAATAGPFSSDNIALLTVERGLWGSVVGPHNANSTVLAPIYHSQGGNPDGSSGGIRYALDPAAEFTANFVASAYTAPNVLDGLWMDCFGSQPFRALDAWGATVGRFMVNVSTGMRYQRSGYVQAQRKLVGRVRSLIEGMGGTHLYANNVDNWGDAPKLLAPGKLLDGGASEAFIGTGDGGCGFDGTWHDHDEESWRSIMAELMNVSLANLAVMPMIGSAGCQSPQLVSQGVQARETIETFAYASFLLVAGTRNQLLGVVPYRFRDEEKGEAGGLEMWLHSRYYWPVGKPVTTAEVLGGYQVSACTLARRFETALVLVNPTTNCTDHALPLNGTWFDPEQPSGSVHRVQMLPQHGKVLLSAPLASILV